MVKILVIYASDYSNTKKMGLAAASGVEAVQNATVQLIEAENVTMEDFTSSDGVLLGTPVHMGSMDWRVKKMIDTVCGGLWMGNKMNGKVAGVFASGSGYGNGGGGVELTFLSMLNNFAELGMIIIPLPKNTENYHKGGLQWGPYGRSADEEMSSSGVTDEVLELTRQHAIHVTRAALSLKENPIY